MCFKQKNKNIVIWLLQELSYVIDLLGRKAQYPTFLSEIFQYILRRNERQVLSRKILGRFGLKYSEVLFEKNSTSGGYKGSVSDKIYDKWLILDKYKYLFTNTHMICIYTHTRYKIFLGVLKRSAQMEESLELSTRTCLPSIWEVRSDF